MTLFKITSTRDRFLTAVSLVFQVDPANIAIEFKLKANGVRVNEPEKLHNSMPMGRSTGCRFTASKILVRQPSGQPNKL